MTRKLQKECLQASDKGSGRGPQFPDQNLLCLCAGMRLCVMTIHYTHSEIELRQVKRDLLLCIIITKHPVSYDFHLA